MHAAPYCSPSRCVDDSVSYVNLLFRKKSRRILDFEAPRDAMEDETCRILFLSSKNSFFESIKEVLMRLILLGCRIIIDVALGIEIL